MKPKHKWIRSTLGHGFMMCAKCKGTDMELIAIGQIDWCKVEDKENETKSEQEEG